MQIPDYDILKKCGHGAFGEVWIAQSRAGSLVALKTIEKSEQIEKELAGLRSYSRITDSPYLIRIFHVGEVGNTLYYTMELADNIGSDELYVPATLSNILSQRKRFAPSETVELGRKLLSGLNALHRAGLMHRDIKPENIIYVKGEPKLSDIGLVRSVSQSLSLGGTLGFIPPERLKRGSSGKNNADDLYALGKVLYCCLTGNGVDDYPSFPLSLLNDEYSHLNEVILTACNRNEALRFKSAEEFLNAMLNGISCRKRFRGFAFRARYMLIGLTAVVFVGGLWWWLGKPNIIMQKREKPLPLGEIRNRTYFSANAEINDPDLDTSQTGFIDPIFRQHAPSLLDYPPRRQETVFNRFSGKDWENLDSNNFEQGGNTLQIRSNPEGGIRLMLPLEFAYAIRFEIDYSKLEGALTFQIASLNSKGKSRSFYQWTLSKDRKVLTLKPLEYQPENQERKILIKSKIQPKDTLGFHKVEMLQTGQIFRLYIDGELVLYAPSFFLEGYFAIFAQGGTTNLVVLKNFELIKIAHDPKCSPEKQYRLPNER